MEGKMDAFKELRIIKKKPMVAQIGGFKPKEGITSWFGGNFALKKSKQWPNFKGEPLVPLIQILTDELGDLGSLFNSTKLIQIFIQKDSMPLNGSKSGDGWLLLEYDDLNELTVVKNPLVVNEIKPFQIKWNESEQYDYPCWEESWNFVDMTEINDSEEFSDIFFDEFTRYSKTKVGGYASYIQSPKYKHLKYIMQISSEEKPGFIIGDNGNIYIYKSIETNEWYIGWDCY